MSPTVELDYPYLIDASQLPFGMRFGGLMCRAKNQLPPIYKEGTSASDITQTEKSWMSRLRNPKLATTVQGSVVSLAPCFLSKAALWAYSGRGSGTPPGHTQILRPRNL